MVADEVILLGRCLYAYEEVRLNYVSTLAWSLELYVVAPIYKLLGYNAVKIDAYIRQCCENPGDCSYNEIGTQERG